MIIPVGHEETTVRRQPWVTLGFVGLCVMVQVLIDLGADPETYARWGLIPEHPRASSLMTYMFVHAGWGHLLGNLLILFLAGPPLEDRWGRSFFAGFYVTAGVAAGGFYTLMAPGSEAPLVGASGAVAGLMGASLVRFWSTNIRFLYFFWLLRPPHGSFQAPAWALLPLWFASSVFQARLADEMGVVSGVAHWCHAGGFAFGAAFAFGMRHWQVEGRYVNPAIEARVTVAQAPLIDEAMELRMRGDPEAAYRLMADTARSRPGDPDLVTAFWELACELRRSDKAVGLMLGIVGQSLARGEGELAVQYWEEIADRVPAAAPDRKLLLQLVPVLLEREKRRRAAQALRQAVDPRLGELTTGAALRVLDLAQGVDPPTALAAAHRALESRDLDLGKRERIESLVAELERGGVSLPAADPTALAAAAAAGDLSIPLECEPDYDFTLPSQSETPPPEPRARELDATGSLVVSDSVGDLTPDLAPAEEWQADSPASVAQASVHEIALASSAAVARSCGLKLVDAIPLELADDSLLLRRTGGASGRIAYRRVQAVAVAAVEGLASRPVLIVDLVVNWNDTDDGPLQVIRLRSDSFDVRKLVPRATRSIDAFRAFQEQLLARTGATPLPDRKAATGRPFRTYPDLDRYQREVLQVGS